MSLTAIQNLEAALAAFDSESTADRQAAAGLCKRFAKRTEFSAYTADEQYKALAISASRRTPQDLELLRDLAEYSAHPHIVTAAKEELDLRTSLFAGAGRRQMMPESLVR